MTNKSAAVFTFPTTQTERDRFQPTDSQRAWMSRPVVVIISQQQAVDLIEELGDGIGTVDLHSAMVVCGRHPIYGSITVVQHSNGDCCVTSRHVSISALAQNPKQ